jgi:hypothetical protein
MAMHNERVGMFASSMAVVALAAGCSSEQPAPIPAPVETIPYIFESADPLPPKPITGVAPIEVPGGPEQRLIGMANTNIITAFGCIVARNGVIIDRSPISFQKEVTIKNIDFTVSGGVDENTKEITIAIAGNNGAAVMEAKVLGDEEEASYGDGYKNLNVKALMQDGKDNAETGVSTTVIAGGINARIQSVDGSQSEWEVVNPETEEPLEKAMAPFKAADRMSEVTDKFVDALDCGDN